MFTSHSLDLLTISTLLDISQAICDMEFGMTKRPNFSFSFIEKNELVSILKSQSLDHLAIFHPLRHNSINL